MKRILLLSGLAASLFIALAAIETVKSDEPFTLAAFAFDMFETALLAVAVVATAYVAFESRNMRRERADLLNDLARARHEGDQWRTAARTHIDGLGRAIHEQFGAWNLSAGEADIAMAMLKGLAHKEIARLRNTSEATVRQQAAAVYRKSGLSSRSEFAAYFLEDLFVPQAERGGSTPASLTLVDRNE